MTSFGQLKNSVQRLEQLNRNMGIIAKIKCSRNAATQKEIKNQPISFFLQILHFAFTEYSPQLYKTILEISPNFKTLSDYKFVQTCFAIARNNFNYKSQITVEQFLQQGKLVQKRLKWVVDVVEQVYKWQSRSKPKSSKQSKAIQYAKQQPVSYGLDVDIDEQELQQREIKIKPTQFSFESTFVPKNKIASDRQHQLVNANTFKANVFPKNLSQANYLSEEEQSEEDRKISYTKVQSLSKEKPKEEVNKRSKQPSQQAEENEQNDFVSRQEYNQMLVMISTLNGTINSLVSKFNNFQGFVSTELSKITARVSLVEQNVKIIKANI